MSPRTRVYIVAAVAVLFITVVTTALYYLVSYIQGVDLNRRAYRQLTAARFDDAISLYGAASHKKLDATTLALVYGNRGWCYTKKEMDDQAIADFSESIRLDPQPVYSVLDRGLAYHRKGEFEEAVRDYATALAKDPNLTDAYHNRGLIRANRGDLTLAIADFSEAIRCDPTNAQFFVDRGMAFLADDNVDAAIANFDSAIGFRRTHAGAYIQRAAAYHRKGNAAKGLADVNEAIREMPETIQLLYARANIYLDRGLIDKAVADCDEALRIDPDYDLGYQTRARAWAAMREWDKVLTDTEAALRIYPKLPLSHYLRGRALMARAEFDDAIAEFDRTLRLEPGAIWAIIFRAHNYSYRREYSRASQDLKRAVERFPKAEASHLGLAWFLATCPHDAYRHGKEAVAEAMRGCEISHWTNWYAADALGAAYAEQGDFDQAIKFANLALTLPGTSPKDRDLVAQRLSRYLYRIAIRDIGGAEISRTLFEEAISAYSQQDYDRALLCLNTVLPPNPGASVSAAVFHFFDGTHDKRTRPPWSPEESATMTNGFYYRGLSYERKREWDNAIADFTTVIWREPRSSLALAERGLSYNHKQRTELALRDFDEMVRLNPNDAMAYALRAETLEMTGQPDAALEVAARALRLDPKLTLAYDVRGRGYARKKDYEKADREFHEAERLDRDHVQTLLASAHAFQRWHDYELAEAEFRETAERFPRSAYAQNALAWLLATCPEAAIRKGTEAVAHATTACELTRWRDAAYLDTLAAAYAETGDFDQAIKYGKEAILKMQPQADYRKEVEEHLVLFERKEPWRTKR